jgi:hypothetical protein
MPGDMSGIGKLFLILGLIAIAGLLAIGGGAWYWWKHHSTDFLEGGKAVMEDGRKSGATLQESGCVTQAVARHKSGPSIASTVRTSVWLTMCLDTSSPQADFCDGVPVPENPVAVGVWAAGACSQHGLADPYCSSIFQSVSSYCASPARTGKMRTGPPPIPPT